VIITFSIFDLDAFLFFWPGTWNVDGLADALVCDQSKGDSERSLNPDIAKTFHSHSLPLIGFLL
jgi:hypothetical protein